ncbi:MAG: SUMF1/EgtB/PvdO family nonheme iron enzyme, partial [Thermoguttaceae bacterium]
DFRRVHKELREILEKAMAEKPDNRFQSIDEFRTALSAVSKSLRQSLFSEPGSNVEEDAASSIDAELKKLQDDTANGPNTAKTGGSPSISIPNPTLLTNPSDVVPVVIPNKDQVTPSSTAGDATTQNEKSPTAENEAQQVGIQLVCPQCGKPVVVNSKVCSSCNRPYEEPCLACSSPNAFWVRNCRSCGVDLLATKKMMTERLYAQQQQIQKLRENYGHNKALPMLQQMSLIVHPDFLAVRDWAKNMFPIVQKERRDIKMGVEAIRAQAKNAFDEQKYEKVQEILTKVPAPLVDDDMRKMYSEAGECLTEVDSLIREIRNSISSKQYNTLLSCVQRYLELKANDPEARSLQEKIEKLTTVVTPSGIKLRRIPAGRFYMGSHDSDEFIRNNERPQHKVTLTHSMFMGVYQITQEDFTKIMEFNPSISTDNPQCPVDNVTWFTVLEFCNKLSDEEGFSHYYELKNVKRRSTGMIEYADVELLGGDGYRLPTEAEWEYACRAGSITPWCFGDLVVEVGQYAWYYDNSQMETQPVGEKKPNAWGLYDMHGNIMEWCYDWYCEFYYQQCGEIDNPTGPDNGTARVLRGGAWQFGAEATRSAYRNSCNPDTSSSIIGFRIARNTTDEAM